MKKVLLATFVIFSQFVYADDILLKHKSIVFSNSKIADFKKSLNPQEAKVFFDIAKNIIDINSAKENDKIDLLFSCKQGFLSDCYDYKLLASNLTLNKINHLIVAYDSKFYNENAVLANEFNIPLNYKRISSRFHKARFHPILKQYKAHLGVDFAANLNTPIQATKDGMVIFVGKLGGYGKAIKIQHSNGIISLYAHMNKFHNKIKKGQIVKQGDVIGYVGSTGLSTGNHLHFGLYQNNQAFDPMKVVKKTSQLKNDDLKNFNELTTIIKKIFQV